MNAKQSNAALTSLCDDCALVTVSEFRAGLRIAKSLIPQGREIVTGQTDLPPGERSK